MYNYLNNNTMNTTISNNQQIAIRIAILWLTIIVGFAMHILADMLPALWGANIAMPDAQGAAPTGMLLFMVGIAFFVPICGLLCINHRNIKAMRGINLVLATIMMLFNIMHTAELFEEFNPVQLLILPVMTALGIYLFVYSLRLAKQKSQEKQ